MKVKDFSPDEFVAKQYEGFKKQEVMLHRLFELVLPVAPEAEIEVRWYGLSQNIQIDLYGKSELKDAPTKLAEQGVELGKIFNDSTGDFNYSFKEGIGTIGFSTLPPNCKLVKKTKVVPVRDAYMKTYYEVECDEKEEVSE